MQHRVDIKIHGRTYTLACTKGEESRLMQLAGVVDARVCQMGRQVPQASEMTLLVLGLLSMADDLQDCQHRLARGSEDSSLDQENVNLLAGHIEKMAERVQKIATRFAVAT